MSLEGRGFDARFSNRDEGGKKFAVVVPKGSKDVPLANKEIDSRSGSEKSFNDGE